MKTIHTLLRRLCLCTVVRKTGRVSAVLLAALAAGGVCADVVHVYEETELDGVVTRIGETTHDTGRTYLTQTAPAKSGYIFTHWSISTQQAFDERDAWGRAYDAAPFILYEDTTLTAHYLPADADTDGDGVPDGWEIYWYGNLEQNGASDTDDDGRTFAEELAAGTNPIMAERRVEGPVRWADGDLLLYNPFGYAPFTLRSEPEGALFATTIGYVRPGETVASYTGDAAGTAFAYWTVNGAAQRDAWGRACDSVAFAMPSNAVELVAVAVDDETEKWQLYWYGTTDVALDSDTDGDGRTFAEELAAGMNPLMPERRTEGPVRWADGDLLQYNPYNLQPYTVRSDPEGELFATTSVYVRAGSPVTSAAFGLADGFAYWTRDGVEQRDAWGRAHDAASFAMPTTAVELVAHVVADADDRAKLYWYGTTNVLMDSDTDGDGLTFAEELAAGTNPLMAERRVEGPVRWADTDEMELNLQVYEQMRGAVVDGAYDELFTSPIAGNAAASATFGAHARPVVVDLDGDGLFDLVVVDDAGARFFLNVGGDGNPEFVETQDLTTNGLDLCGADLSRLADFAYDVAPVGAVSWTRGDADQDGVDDLLLGDAEGRIWYYRAVVTAGAEGTSATNFVLQHKVWGGAFPGFAAGPSLAAVDWDGDGDLDCLVGTADGKLMLLRDPKAGRPTNFRLVSGVDGVLLTWDPNAQSRIRGYRVYRSAADAAAYESLVSPYVTLPTYRDTPPASETGYDYRVSSVSRFYTAGSSTATESESMPTEALRGNLGRVSLAWRDAAAFAETNVEVALAVADARGLSGEGLALEVRYDPAVLTPVAVRTSGLTEGVALTDAAADGVWTVSGTSGAVAGGAGTLASFVFRTCAVDQGAVTTAVSLASATLKSAAGVAVAVDLPATHATVVVSRFDDSDANPSEDASGEDPDLGEDVDPDEDMDDDTVIANGYGGRVMLGLGTAVANVGDEVELPLGILSFMQARDLELAVTGWRLTFTYDPALLEPTGVTGVTGTYAWEAENGTLTVTGTAGTLPLPRRFLCATTLPLKLKFKALEQYASHEAAVRIRSSALTTTAGRRVLCYTSLLCMGRVLIRYQRPPARPDVVVPCGRGDVNGDGRLTAADLDLLARLMNDDPRRVTREQLRAGDYNGNGWLDGGDYALMRDDFERRGVDVGRGHGTEWNGGPGGPGWDDGYGRH